MGPDVIAAAVEGYRQLSDRQADTPRVELAGSLTAQAAWLGELGHTEKAVDAIREAIDQYRQLAKNTSVQSTIPSAYVFSPYEFFDDLATALRMQSMWLRALGRAKEADAAIEEALAASERAVERYFNRDGVVFDERLHFGYAALVFLDLRAVRPAGYRREIARCLMTKAVWLYELGHIPEALQSIEYAVDINWLIAVAYAGRLDGIKDPGELYLLKEAGHGVRYYMLPPELAVSLQTQAEWLHEYNLPKFALRTIQEATTVYWRLETARPCAFRSGLARALASEAAWSRENARTVSAEEKLLLSAKPAL
jgi:tetratricopeptide (TPR) repeat protein